MFTENQSRQFYVATATGNDVIAPVEVDSTHSATDLSAKSSGACQFVINPAKNETYLMYKGPSKDGVQRSDLIKKCNIMDVRLTDAADLKHKAKKAIVTIDPSLVSSSNLTTTDDYILNVEIQGYIATGSDSKLIKFGAAKGVQGTSASNLYKKLALSLAKNFGNEPVPLVDIYLCKTDLTSATSTSAKFIKVTKQTAESSLTDTYIGICIEEAEQDTWRLGAAPVEYVNFAVSASTVTTSAGDVVWGKVQFYGNTKYTDGTSSSIAIGAPYSFPNSKMVADMEWFFHKNRGDIYGQLGWPDNIDTEYLVNPANTDGYSFIDIHYYTEGNSHNIGKSEKTLTVVGTKANLKKLFGSPATTGQTPTAATGLYAFLADTGVSIITSATWSS